MNPDPYNLERFLSAQSEMYDQALQELEFGLKESHWIWYVFPQIEGLGYSPMSIKYAISSKEEAIAYLQHSILGKRLQECCKALLKHQSRDIERIMGDPDDLKLCSSMTLFATIAPQDSIFQKVLDAFYNGKTDAKTISFLENFQDH